MASEHSPDTPPTTNLGGSSSRYRKSRGRPKKDSERDTSADRRRARGRIAQDAFRRRKQALTTSMKQKNLALVNIIEQMSTGFTDFADELLRSEHFRNDRALTYHLSLATRRFVELARVATQSPVPGSGPAEEYFSNIPTANALRPQGGHTRWAPAEAILPAGASSLSWQSHQPIPTFHDMVFVSHDPLRDEQALGASSLMQPLGVFPTTPPPFSVESAAVRYPFGSRLLLYTLEFVYSSLLGRDNYTPHLAIQIFRLTLAEHTRPQILSAIRWYLGPGYSYTVSLGGLYHESFRSRGLPESVPVVESSLDPINSRETWTFGDAIFPVRQGRERDQYLSAYEIEEYLKTRAISEMDVDTFRIKIKSPNHLPASRCHENLTPSSFDSSPGEHRSIFSTDNSLSNVPLSNSAVCDIPSSATNRYLQTFPSTAGDSSFKTTNPPLTGDRLCGNQEGCTREGVPNTRPPQPQQDLVIAIDMKSFMRRLSTTSTCLTYGPGYPCDKIDELLLESAVL